MIEIDLCWRTLKTIANTNAFVLTVVHPKTQMLI
jgi:hypothetical protein